MKIEHRASSKMLHSVRARPTATKSSSLSGASLAASSLALSFWGCSVANSEPPKHDDELAAARRIMGLWFVPPKPHEDIASVEGKYPRVPSPPSQQGKKSKDGTLPITNRSPSLNRHSLSGALMRRNDAPLSSTMRFSKARTERAQRILSGKRIRAPLPVRSPNHKKSGGGSAGGHRRARTAEPDLPMSRHSSPACQITSLAGSGAKLGGPVD
jgi:hypothetical protein